MGGTSSRAYHFGLLDVESSECLRHWVQHLLEAIILPLETGTEVVQVAMVTQEYSQTYFQLSRTTASSNDRDSIWWRHKTCGIVGQDQSVGMQIRIKLAMQY